MFINMLCLPINQSISYFCFLNTQMQKAVDERASAVDAKLAEIVAQVSGLRADLVGSAAAALNNTASAAEETAAAAAAKALLDQSVGGTVLSLHMLCCSESLSSAKSCVLSLSLFIFASKNTNLRLFFKQIKILSFT